MHVDERQILGLSKELWASQLGLNIQPGEADSDRTLSSCIKVSGPWQGTILFECSEAIVRHAAATFYAADGEDTSDEEIEDALKDLAEMVGKKIRTLLPESTKLSRPTVVAGEEGSRSLSDQKELSDLRLNCEGRPVRISLLAAAEGLAAAS